MTAHCCRTKIKLKEVDVRRLRQALGGLFEHPMVEIATAFKMVVRNVPTDLDQKMGATTNLAGAIYLLKLSQRWHQENPGAVPPTRHSVEKALLIKNVACFCRKPAEA